MSGTTRDAHLGRSRIRTASRAAVLDVLRRRGRVTRAELSLSTGLSRSTVSGIVAELQSRGLVLEVSGSGLGGAGRPPGQVMLDRSAGLAVGVDLRVRQIAMAGGDT